MAHDHEMYMTLADTAVEVRDAAALKKYSPLLEELARRDDHKLYLAIAYRARGVEQRLAGKMKQSEEMLKQSLELFGEFGARWQTGRTLLELADLELARSKKAKARQYLTEALAAFDAVRAIPDAARASRLLNSIGD